jgi:hypothetical protein
MPLTRLEAAAPGSVGTGIDGRLVGLYRASQALWTGYSGSTGGMV